MNKLLIIIFLCLVFFGLSNEAAAQCNPDIVPPQAVCTDGLIYQASVTGNETALINAEDFDAGSTDNCTSQSQLSFFIEEGTGNSTPPATTSLELGVGQYIITLWVVDQAGNHNKCWASLTVNPNCSATDVTPPVAACLSNYTLGLVNGQAILQAISLNDGSYDNCPNPTQTIELAPASATPPTTTSLVFTASNLGETEVVYWAVDAAGNGTPCLSTVTVDTCISSGTMACNDMVTVEVGYQETVSLYPEGVLEGGPYCYDQMVIGNALFGVPTPFMSFTNNDAGSYTVQVTNVLTGNSCWGTVIVTADCTGDVQPPTAVCQSQLSFQLSMNGPDLTILQAGALDGGSFDDCSGFNNLVFEAQVGPILPTMTELVFTSVGTYTNIVLWVGDQEGNFSSCNTTVTIDAPSCSPDTLSPRFVYVPNDTTVEFDYVADLNNAPHNTTLLNQLLGEATAWDFCGLDTIVQTVDVEKNNCGFLRKITRLFWATDNAGNLTHASQTIHVKLPPSTMFIPADFLPGDLGDPADLIVVDTPGSSLIVFFDDFETPSQCDTLPIFIRRSWVIANICEGQNGQFPINLPRLDLNGDNLNGDAYIALSAFDSVYINNSSLPALIPSHSMYRYEQIIRYSYEDTVSNSVTGTVFHDIDANCGKNGNEPGLASWTVKAIGNTTGQLYSTTTLPNGVYQINDICAADTELELSLDVPFNYGQNCQTTWIVQTIPNMTVVQHIPVQLDNECALMEVNLAAPFLRRCFPNTYMVSYCNYSSQVIEDAYVEVQLDSFMEFITSSLPEVSLGDNRYSFELGDLAPGECGSFPVAFMLNCDAVLGQTHCSEAHIYPDTLCPASSNWSGANIEVEGECINDEIHLTIKNTGTGAMAAPLVYIIVEDVIMYTQGEFNLGAGETYQVPPIAANGATWRLEAEQAPEHPYPGSVAVALEGCDGINEIGLVNLFPVENPNPFIAVDCQENIGAFDPNDKQAQPRGYGEEHFIHRNTDIEYTIRFQNTGTDTAFNVVILDKLSEYLDPTSVRPGASSHDYSFELIGGDSLRFTFANIMLPDSNINLAASQGFVQFVAKQMPDVALGSVIENTADIYFDFNEPVITNTVFHTIGENFIEVLNDVNEASGLGQAKVFPNPSMGAVTFSLPLDLGENSRFTLHDNLGKLARTQAVSGNRFVFERKDLAPGIYFYSIENEGLRLFTGKVILK